MHTKYSLSARVAAAVATFALAFSSFGTAFAAANEFTATVTAPTDGTPGATLQTVTFTFATNADALAAGDKIVVTIPDDFGNFSNVVAGDVSVTTVDTSINNGAAETFDTTLRTITYVLAGGESAAAAETVTISIASRLTLPSSSGQYALHVATKNSSDVVQETGYAVVNVDNTVAMVAVVEEALILTADDTTVNLNVDPSVNNGEDYSQKNTLTVKTNAKNGYKIQGKLDDGAGAANLKNATTGDTIASGNAESTENRFGYLAYNSSATKTQAELTSEGTPQTFSNASANLADYAGTANNVTLSGVTNTQNHTVYYALNVDYLTPAGTYSGTITYTAVPTF